ncbi:MAG: hypothetical protein RL097_748 [Candidatus Parcubacteria bacterium]|jgi:hypothetical protein
MNIYNRIFFTALMGATTFLIVLLGGFLTVPPLAAAQTEMSCPLHSDVRVTIVNSTEHSLQEIHTIEVRLENQNSQYLPGVRVAVALFSKNDLVTPKFWRVTNEAYLLAPAAEISVLLESDVSKVSAGEYVLKAFAFQGSEADLLGIILRDAEKATGITFKKTTAAETEVSFLVSIDNELVQNERTMSFGDIPQFKVETKNLGKVPIFNTTLLHVVTQGNVPLGGAVVRSVSDETTLLPKFARINEFSTQPYGFAAPGLLIATLIDSTGFAPIKIIDLSISGEDEVVSWLYLSRIGFSQYPLTEEDQIVSCVSYIGPWEELNFAPELLGASVEILNQEQVLYSESVFNEQDRKRYFSFRPELVAGTFNVSFVLSQKRLNSVLPDGDTSSAQSGIKNGLTLSDRKSFSLVCQEESCQSIVATREVDEERETVASNVHSFWFYAGIVIAAALLMYLMLRRLDPVSPTNKAGEVNQEELQ